MSFLVTGFLVGLLGGSLGSGGEHYDFHTPFLEEISGWDAKKTWTGMLGRQCCYWFCSKGGEQHLEKFGSYGLDLFFWMILDDFGLGIFLDSSKKGCLKRKQC